jgi:hypothetical protein
MAYPSYRGELYDLKDNSNYTNVVIDLLDFPSDDPNNNGFPTLSTENYGKLFL